MPDQDKITQEIVRLLDRNFIFDRYFVVEVRNKLAELKDAQLRELRKILAEADDYQRELLAKKIREDKKFYARVLAEKKKFDKTVLELYEKKLHQQEKGKLDALMARMRHL